jgi:hypothetical protein
MLCYRNALAANRPTNGRLGVSISSGLPSIVISISH